LVNIGSQKRLKNINFVLPYSLSKIFWDWYSYDKEVQVTGTSMTDIQVGVPAVA
jgi:hypothetical protein